jgi:hypothetical protein
MFSFAAAFDIFLRLQVANLGAFFIFLNHLFSIVSLLSCRSLIACLRALPGAFFVVGSFLGLFSLDSCDFVYIKNRTAEWNHSAALFR